MCRTHILLITLGFLLRVIPTNAAAGSDLSLVGWWKFDESSGKTAVDSSPYGNSGAIIGDPGRVAGWVNGALEFDGDGDYVVISNAGNALGKFISGQFSVSAWIKGGKRGQVVFSQQNGANWLMADQSAGRLTTELTQPALSGSVIVADGQWCQVCVKWDGVITSLYTNNTLITQAPRRPSGFSTGDFYVGCGSKRDKFWDGAIDDVQVKGLSQPEPPAPAREPKPASGQMDVGVDVVLSWTGGQNVTSYKVYWSDDWGAVANGRTALVGSVDANSYKPGPLQYGQVYFWRIDEVYDGASTTPVEGGVWMFSTTDYVVDDFESYTSDSPNRIYQTWIDGQGFAPDKWFPNGEPGNGTGAKVGYDNPPYVELTTVYRGRQSMPLSYNNSVSPCYSETERNWNTPQNWIIGDVDSLCLSLYVHGQEDNCRAPMYLGVKDNAGNTYAVVSEDGDMSVAPQWTEWRIPLRSFRDAGVDLTRVRKLFIGIGDRDNPTSCAHCTGAHSLMLASAGENLVWIDEVTIQKWGAKVTGTVRDEVTGKPIPDAQITTTASCVPVGTNGIRSAPDGSYCIGLIGRDCPITVTPNGDLFWPKTFQWVCADWCTKIDLLLTPKRYVAVSCPIRRFRSPTEPNSYYFASEKEETETLLYDDTPAYTSGGEERLDPDRWIYDGIAFCAWDTNTPPDPNALKPVYRFVHKDDARQIPAYAFDVNDLTDSPDLWEPHPKFDPIAFYAYRPEGIQPGGTVAIYRVWSESLKCYGYFSEADISRFREDGWVIDTKNDLAWYAKDPTQNTP